MATAKQKVYEDTQEICPSGDDYDGPRDHDMGWDDSPKSVEEIRRDIKAAFKVGASKMSEQHPWMDHLQNVNALDEIGPGT